MKRGTGLFGAAAAGAMLMYLFDPVRGRRRRSVARDKVVSAASRLGDAFAVTARDVANRTRGQGARLRSMLTLRAASDHEIRETVRSEIGVLVRHPGAIDVRVEEGRVVVTGPVLEDELDRLLSTISGLRGVRDVENHLTVHREPGDVPGLQGEPMRPRRGRSVLPWSQRVWSPAERLGAGLLGGSLAVWAMGRGGVSGAASGLAGVGLLLRGITNTELRKLTGLGAGRQAVTVQKTINVQASPHDVFAFWSHPESFPRVMAHVREVRPSADGRWHWKVTGPAGMPIEFDTEISAYVPDKVLGWRTVPGALVAHSGIVRFEPVGGGTRVHIRMSYNPPAGAIGHAVAAFFGSDPKHAMDEDLVRFKSLMERGKTRAHGEPVHRGDLGV